MSHIDVIAAVIEQNERILICRRPPHKRHGGLWEFPGGKVEEGESFEAAARRELREELDLELLHFVRVLYTRSDPGTNFVIHFTECLVSGAAHCHEHTELAWVLRADLLSYELAPGDREFAAFLRGAA